MTSLHSDVMPRPRLIGRCCDVIILVSLLSLGAVFLTHYADITRRRNSRDFSAVDVTPEDEKSLGWESPPILQTTDDVLGRIPDSRPDVCRDRKSDGVAVATVVVVFSDYEFYDAKLTLTSILRDSELPPRSVLSEIILVDDASNHESVFQVMLVHHFYSPKKRTLIAL